MFCKNCGAEIPDGATVCEKCGKEVSAAKKIEETLKNTAGGSIFKGCYKSKDGKLLTGVCAGLGKKFNKNPWLFRAVFIVSGIIPVIGWFFLGYYIAAIITWKFEDEAA